MAVSSLAATAASESRILDAIANASGGTGVSFNYLLAAARRESGLNPNAKSSTSSASGLFQFVGQTWLSTIKAHGAEVGLGRYAAAVEETSPGRYDVRDPALKAEILALRQDPATASKMAAALAGDNAKVLTARLGRPPSEGELYAAHVLGAAGAAKLIAGMGQNPSQPAAAVFPEAAPANRGLFYDAATGAPVTLAALHARLTGDARPAPAAMTAFSPPAAFSGAAAAARAVAFPESMSPAGLQSAALKLNGDALTVLNAVGKGEQAILFPRDEKDKDKDKEQRFFRRATI